MDPITPIQDPLSSTVQIMLLLWVVVPALLSWVFVLIGRYHISKANEYDRSKARDKALPHMIIGGLLYIVSAAGFLVNAGVHAAHGYDTKYFVASGVIFLAIDLWWLYSTVKAALDF